MKKRMYRDGLEPGISYQTDTLDSMAMVNLYFGAIFDRLLELLPHSKFAKADLCSINGYHNKWQEPTYYIEALCSTGLGTILVKSVRTFK